MNKTLLYLYSLEHFGMKLGLRRMKWLVKLLGNPEHSFQSIHVAGTNGKGSTCAYIESILHEAGYTVGLYTSPHLINFNERIQVNGKPISDKELTSLTAEIRQKTKKAKIQPTFFEFTMALAFLHFVRQKVDVAVIETGMGGRLDATNVITPLISGITNIDFDHMKHLGSTKLQIAREKAGIIKPGVPVVTGEEEITIKKYFKQVCRERGSTFYSTGDLLTVKGIWSGLSGQEFTVKGQVKGSFKIRLLGNHQLQNAATALLAVQVLREQGVKIDDSALRRGLANAYWPGRIEIICRKPLIILDGAHNVAGMTQLRNFVRGVPHRKVLVLGVAKDKQYQKMLSLIVPLFDIVVITQGNFKPQDTLVLAKEVQKYGKPVYEILPAEDALAFAASLVNSQDTILVTGSLYLIGDVLAVLRKEFSNKRIN